MARIGMIKDFLQGLSRFSWLSLALGALLLPMLIAAAPLPPPAPKIEVFPSSPYYAYLVYEYLAVFWVAILGLLVIIRMKLREIERVQKLGMDVEDKGAPLLQ